MNGVITSVTSSLPRLAWHGRCASFCWHLPGPDEGQQPGMNITVGVAGVIHHAGDLPVPDEPVWEKRLAISSASTPFNWSGPGAPGWLLS